MNYLRIKRIMDLVLAIFFLGLLAPLIFIIYLLVKLTSHGPAIYWSDRYGRNNIIFKMPKFRTMQINTPVVAIPIAAAM
jgi:O-antigen biosynthesis protein WbqP